MKRNCYVGKPFSKRKPKKHTVILREFVPLVISVIALLFSIYQSALMQLQTEKSYFLSQYYSLKVEILKNTMHDVSELKIILREGQTKQLSLDKYLSSLELLKRVFNSDKINESIVESERYLSKYFRNKKDSEALENALKHLDLLMDSCYEILETDRKNIDTWTVFSR